MIYYLILILIIILIWYFYIKNNDNIENFEDRFDDFEKYEDIYDDEFSNLYEIIYRDFSDIEKDLEIIKTFVFNKTENSIAVLGCGTGKLCKSLKENYKDVIGVDISENILKKAQSIYPNIKFVRGNIIREKILNKSNYSHIFMDERTLYYNKIDDFNKIIINCYFWLKEDGYLIIPIYDPLKLQLACRYYSSKYIDNKGNTHGFTYLNNFSHDCYYIKDDDDKDTYYYYDKIIFDTDEKRIKKTTFYIPSKEITYDKILNNGFDLVHIEKIRLQIVGGYEIGIFKKKKKILSVEEIEKKYLINKL
jgi:SAM-dependent methyltransferase